VKTQRLYEKKDCDNLAKSISEFPVTGMNNKIPPPGLVIVVGSKKALGIAVKNDETQKRFTWLRARLENC
jgi:hypothetical protein